ncbi:hypothetical protein EOL73_04465 [Candidatus Saccharibacteria bacterium]|nr:hypothetical protein [Candidatus Saccharibacteria bacterium]NCU40978.1 hypothetical protein [Candidatus Saccharibacteria bacterium]
MPNKPPLTLQEQIANLKRAITASTQELERVEAVAQIVRLMGNRAAEEANRRVPDAEAGIAAIKKHFDASKWPREIGKLRIPTVEQHMSGLVLLHPRDWGTELFKTALGVDDDAQLTPEQLCEELLDNYQPKRAYGGKLVTEPTDLGPTIRFL